jgi:hypothetical protein
MQSASISAIKVDKLLEHQKKMKDYVAGKAIGALATKLFT